jgi:hypothetical protein
MTEARSAQSALSRGWEFLRDAPLRVALLSAALLLPCFWHGHIEAGDLGSHVYNAWVAQLIVKGQAPGLYLAQQWNNVLFDLLLQHTANVLRFAVAEKIVVALAVLVFFWGVFALIAAISSQPPWFLTPCLAILSYGYCFHMGFFNYYLSIGLACWSLAIFLGRLRGDKLTALIALPIIYLAHPVGFLFAVCGMGYLTLREVLPGYWKAAVPLIALAAVLALRWFLMTRVQYEVDWSKDGPFYVFNGSDQAVVYGDQYASLARVAIVFAVICILVDAIFRRRESRSSWKPFALPLELYFVAFLTTALLPENLRTAPENGWIGLLVSRLTVVSAIFGLAVLACMKPRKWHLAGFALLACAFFVFLHEDTGFINEMERNAEILLWPLPYGTRVVPALGSLPGSRIEFLGHLADRACIGHCFSVLNYEAPTKQFRVRARPGSRLALSSFPEYEEQVSDAYVFRAEDLPLTLIYQCDQSDLRRLCLRELAAGDTVRSAEK